MGLFIPGFIIAPESGGGPLTLTYLNAGGSSANDSTYSFTSLNAGDPGDADNYMVIALYGEKDNNNTLFTCSDCDFGSNQMTYLGGTQRQDTGRSITVELWGGFVSGDANQTLSYTWTQEIARTMYARAKIKGSVLCDIDPARTQNKSAGSGGDITFDDFTLADGEWWVSATLWRPATSVMSTSGVTEHVENTAESAIRSTFCSSGTAGTISQVQTSSGGYIAAVGVVFTGQ